MSHSRQRLLTAYEGWRGPGYPQVHPSGTLDTLPPDILLCIFYELRKLPADRVCDRVPADPQGQGALTPRCAGHVTLSLDIPAVCKSFAFACKELVSIAIATPSFISMWAAKTHGLHGVRVWAIGDKVRGYYHGERKIKYPGVITKINANGSCMIRFDTDGNVETPVEKDDIFEEGSGGRQMITDIGLEALTTGRFRAVKELSVLSDDDDFLDVERTDATLVMMAQSLHTRYALQKLEIHILHAKGVRALGAFSNLEYLDLSCTREVTDFHVNQIATKCKRIKTLYLHGCPRLTDKGFASVGLLCPQLEHLSIPNAVDERFVLVTNASLKSIGAGCPLLKALSLQDCCGINDTGKHAQTYIIRNTN